MNTYAVLCVDHYFVFMKSANKILALSFVFFKTFPATHLLAIQVYSSERRQFEALENSPSPPPSYLHSSTILEWFHSLTRKERSLNALFVVATFDLQRE